MYNTNVHVFGPGGIFVSVSPMIGVRAVPVRVLRPRPDGGGEIAILQLIADKAAVFRRLEPGSDVGHVGGSDPGMPRFYFQGDSVRHVEIVPCYKMTCST